MHDFSAIGKMKDFKFAVVHNREIAHSLNYHAAWTTSFNRKVLTGEVADFVLEETRRRAEKLDLIIHKLRIVNESCVEIVFSAPLKHSLTDILKAIKGNVAQQVFMKFPEVKDQCYMQKLWNRSYYIETVGMLSSITVKDECG